MSREILVYGHGDKSANGFPTAEDFVEYIAGGIFDDEYRGRYRYSQTKSADVIVLARDGLAYGHFEISTSVEPTAADRKTYPRVKKVYLVHKSVEYREPVRLSALGISKYQWGKRINEDQFKEILNSSSEKREFSAK
jgi:hypothetical protein